MTELAVLALFGLVVSIPYLEKMQAGDFLSQNMLDMGPFHDQVKQHISKPQRPLELIESI